MNKQVLIVGALGALVVFAVAGVALYNFVLGPTLAPSGAITAIPVVLATQPAGATEVTEATAPPDAVEPTAAAAEPTTAPAADGVLILNIDQSRSEVRFILDEELRGTPTTVVGATDQVAGQIAIDPNDLSTVQVGVIQVNARTLATDSNQRNSAIRNRILHTDTYEFITFTPTEVRGLTGTGAPGDTFTFQLVGDLTIRDITQPVVFEVTATADSATQISGSAVTTVQRADFELVIPSVPQVANVTEAVQLEIDFVATPAS